MRGRVLSRPPWQELLFVSADESLEISLGDKLPTCQPICQPCHVISIFCEFSAERRTGPWQRRTGEMEIALANLIRVTGAVPAWRDRPMPRGGGNETKMSRRSRGKRSAAIRVRVELFSPRSRPRRPETHSDRPPPASSSVLNKESLKLPAAHWSRTYGDTPN